MKAVMWWVVILGVQAPGMLASQADTSVAPLELRARADSNDPLALYDLAHAYYALGLVLEPMQQPQSAGEAYDRFLQLAPSRYGDMIADAKARREHLPQ
jgi:tetratricopeptide (TPR) repeat protein